MRREMRGRFMNRCWFCLCRICRGRSHFYTKFTRRTAKITHMCLAGEIMKVLGMMNESNGSRLTKDYSITHLIRGRMILFNHSERQDSTSTITLSFKVIIFLQATCSQADANILVKRSLFGDLIFEEKNIGFPFDAELLSSAASRTKAAQVC